MSTDIYRKAGAVGMLNAIVGWPEDIEGMPPRPTGFDGFFTVIAYDELSRTGSGGVVWGLVGGFGIGCPPVAHFGSEYASGTDDSSLRFLLTRGHWWGALVHPIRVLSGVGSKLPVLLYVDVRTFC